MKGIRGALVLLPTDLGAEPIINPSDQWLATAGWDADSLQLRPPSTHATLGWRECAVGDCDRPAWGTRAEGLCPGCDTQWQVQGKPDREVFDRQPVKRHRVAHRLSRCSVTRDGIQCGRDAQNQGLCAPHSFTVMRSKRERHVVIAGLTPLSGLGRAASRPVIASLISPEPCSAKPTETGGEHTDEPTRARISTTGVGAKSK